MSRLTGVFTVDGSHFVDAGEHDLAELTVDQVAELVEQEDSGISLCHQCAHEISDPATGDLTVFTVDGVDFELSEDGHWTADHQRVETYIRELHHAGRLGYLRAQGEWVNGQEPLILPFQNAADRLLAAGHLPEFKDAP